jgi:hypothetical protein
MGYLNNNLIRFKKANHHISTPRIITVNKHVASPTAFTSLKVEVMRSDPCELWLSPYLNHLVEHDHCFSDAHAEDSPIRDVEKGNSMKQVACIANLYCVAV